MSDSALLAELKNIFSEAKMDGIGACISPCHKSKPYAIIARISTTIAIP